MNESLIFADVDLPFHVWVRESTGRESRWVLRHASEVRRGAHMPGGGSASDAAPGRRPRSPL